MTFIFHLIMSLFESIHHIHCSTCSYLHSHPLCYDSKANKRDEENTEAGFWVLKVKIFWWGTNIFSFLSCTHLMTGCEVGREAQLGVFSNYLWCQGFALVLCAMAILDICVMCGFTICFGGFHCTFLFFKLIYPQHDCCLNDIIFFSVCLFTHKEWNMN